MILFLFLYLTYNICIYIFSLCLYYSCLSDLPCGCPEMLRTLPADATGRISVSLSVQLLNRNSMFFRDLVNLVSRC